MQTVPFRIDPVTFPNIAGEAVQRANELGEQSMAVRYNAGVPVKAQGPLYASRFADENPTVRELIVKQIEERGGLGPVVDDKKNKLARNHMKATMDQMMNGSGVLGPEEVA